MTRWTPGRAARLGYLAGRGASARAIVADDKIGARSERAVRMAVSRWGLTLGAGAFAVPLTADDREALRNAADDRGVTPDALAALILRLVCRDGLLSAVLDDEG
jgi:hypothetical protein